MVQLDRRAVVRELMRLSQAGGYHRDQMLLWRRRLAGQVRGRVSARQIGRLGRRLRRAWARYTHHRGEWQSVRHQQRVLVAYLRAAT